MVFNNGFLFGGLIAFATLVTFITYIVQFAHRTMWYEMTRGALAKAAIIMGLLLTLLMYVLLDSTLPQLVAISVGNIVVMWILLPITIKRFIRFFYPDIVFKSWSSLIIDTHGNQKIYNWGLLDNLLD